MTQGSLQAALPREMYVDGSRGLRSARGAVRRSGTASGAWTISVSTASARVVVVDVVGESVLVTSDGHGSCTLPTTSAATAAHSSVPRRRAVDPTCCVCRSALRCPYHSWTYALDGRLINAPHADLDGLELDAFGSTRSRVDTWGGFVFVHLTPERATPLAARSARRRQRWPTTVSPALVTGATLTYEVAANYKVLLENYNECYHCGPVHPELCRLVPSFAGGGDDLDWEGGIPHREGAWTFTITGTTTVRRCPVSTEQERHAAQGRSGLPEPAAVRLGRPRGRVRAACRVAWTAPTWCARCCSPPTRSAPPFDPSDAAELWDLVNRQDWAICESVQRGMSSRELPPGLVRPDGGREPRHPPLAAAPAGAGTDEPSTSTTSSPVWARSAARPPMELARRGHRVLGLERFELGHSRGASHDTSRILRHSYHTPAYVRADAGGVRRLGRLERDCGEQPGHAWSVGSTCSRRTRPSARSTTSARWPQVGIDYDVLDGGRGLERWPQLRLPEGPLALHQPRCGDRAGRAGTRVMQDHARRHGADLRELQPGRQRRATSALAASRWRRRHGVLHCRRPRRLRGRVDQRRARRPRAPGPARSDARAGDLLRAARACRLRPGRLPLWIWMDDPSLLRLPDATARPPSRLPRTAVGRSSTRSGVPYEPDPAMEALLAAHLRGMLPGSGSAGALGRAASTR